MASAASHSSNEHIAKGKANTCAFYMKRILPRKEMHKSVVLSAADDLLALTDQQFDYV
jgi:tRNA A37 threonylcarbamoyladenosine dehydratase